MELDFSKNINDASGLKGLIHAETAKKEVNLLPDSEFAYIEKGGTIDTFNRTVPLGLRHFPVANEEQINSSLDLLISSKLREEIKKEIFEKIEARAKKMNLEISESAMPPWLKDKKDDKKDDKKSGDKKSDDKKSDDKKSDKKDESKAELSKEQKKLPPAIQKSILEKQKKSGDKEKKEGSKDEPKEESDAMKMEKDDAMMKKMYSRMDEIEKAKKDMDKEYAMIKNKLGAMMKKVKASSSESN